MATPAPKTTEQRVKEAVDLLKDRWQKDKKTIIQQAVIVGGVFILAIFVFFPLFFKIHTMKGQIKNLEFKINTAQEKIKHEINIVDLTEKEFTERKKNKDEFIADIFSGKVIKIL